jgi:hypothetical protein
MTPSEEPATAPPDEWNEAPGEVRLPGVSAPPVWTLPDSLRVLAGPRAAPTTAAAAKPTDRDVAGRVLRGALDDRDRRLGLSPTGGAVASIVAESVQVSSVPLEARGGFEVRLGPDGSFAGIRVLGTSAGDANAWNDAARRAARRLAAARVRLQPDESGGVIVRVEVESRNRYPAGSETVAELDIRCADDDAYDAIEREVKDQADPTSGPLARKWRDPEPERQTEFDPERIGQPAPPVVDARPPRTLGCVPTKLMVRFDLSNIGAHKIRTVRSNARVVPLPGSSATPRPPSPRPSGG